MPSLKEISNMNNNNAINAVNNLLITVTSSSVSYYPKLEGILHRIGRDDYNKCAHAIITVLNCTINPNDNRNNYIPASSLAKCIESSISKSSKYIKTGDNWATIIINDYDSFVNGYILRGQRTDNYTVNDLDWLCCKQEILNNDDNDNLISAVKCHHAGIDNISNIHIIPDDNYTTLDFINHRIDNDNVIKAKIKFLNDISMNRAFDNENKNTLNFIKLLAKVHSSETEWNAIKDIILTPTHDRYKLITDNDIKLFNESFQWHNYIHPTTPNGYMTFAHNGTSWWRWQSSNCSYKIGWCINDYSMITSAGIASILFFINENSTMITDIISTTDMNSTHSLIISIINDYKNGYPTEYAIEHAKANIMK